MQWNEVKEKWFLNNVAHNIMAVLCRLVSVLYLTKDLGRNMNYITVFSEYFYHYGPSSHPVNLYI